MKAPRALALRSLAWVAACLAGSPATCYAQTPPVIPQVQATALSGQLIRLPQDLPPQAVLILGFSQKSSAAAEACGKRLAAALANRPEVKVYQIPVLEEVPGLVRGLVTRSMRKSVPEPLQATFVPVFHDENQWKRVSGYTSPDDAYILLTGRQGQIIWRTHGPCSAGKISDLTLELDKAK